VRDLTDAQRQVFQGPIDPDRWPGSDKLPQAGQCICEPWPCDGPGSAQWATCLGNRCKGCRLYR
jgi:hypothetical protein